MNKYLPKYSEYLLLITLVWLVPDAAYASSVSTVLCTVGGYIWGPVGSVLAMLGVVAIGLISMFGKIQISSVLTVMVGIALIFGAPGILEQLLGSSFSNSCGITVSTAEAKAIANSTFYLMLSCILSWFLGPVGKAIATVSMILLGLFASYGRISWYQALLVAVGIATMFGSVGIVQSLGVPVYDSKGVVNNLSYGSLCMGSVSSVISIEKILCNMIGWFTGPIGKGIATLAIIILGIGALFAKVSWGMTMVVALGAAMVFGSTGIVKALGADPLLYGCGTGDLRNPKGVRPMQTLPTLPSGPVVSTTTPTTTTIPLPPVTPP
ncbi:MAG: TrbC/VirB2 family protein [Rickettsiales bacterium]|nr:TrbC/VirB2 family protein [Rickettsiales bacterium]